MSDSESTMLVVGIPTGTISFDVTVSSELDHDYLELYINGQSSTKNQVSFSGSVNLPMVRDSNNSLMIKYVKDGSLSYGDDRVTMKNFAYTDEIKISKSEGTQNAALVAVAVLWLGIGYLCF
ncbi:CUB domain-containing protein [Vibrio chagasii]|nr:CUB domain-containing protein [Vibrio chagasii]